MIPVLCAHCAQHILNVDEAKLSWPFTREMFTPAKQGFNDWNLPAVLIDAWCPYCEQFPFYADMESGGLKARLRIKTADGKERFITGFQVEEPPNALDRPDVQETQQGPQPQPIAAGSQGSERNTSGKRERGQGDKDSKLAGKKGRKKPGRPKKTAH